MGLLIEYAQQRVGLDRRFYRVCTQKGRAMEVMKASRWVWTAGISRIAARVTSMVQALSDLRAATCGSLESHPANAPVASLVAAHR